MSTEQGRSGAIRILAPYASDASASRGRLLPEPESPTRSPFQRDRDRVIHSTAFRRLTHKTQVFIHHEGDHYRTRLTHSLEVAQIARSLARTLRLDEDLAEAIALAHDLGHPPFGHAGERALDAAMTSHGGFDHNLQSFHVVTELERRYAAFDGLNLSWETLEGLAKHNGPIRDRSSAAASAYGGRYDLALERQASVEGQLAALSDDIAYNAHDVDDGYRAGLLTIEDLRSAPLIGRMVGFVEDQHSGIADARLVPEVNRRLITALIEDVFAETQQRIAVLGPQSVDDIRHAHRPVAAFSADMAAVLSALSRFLLDRVYRNPRILKVMDHAAEIVRDLFDRFRRDSSALPGEWRDGAPLDETAYARHVCDYIAGMTDRYAIGEHRRLFDRTPDLR